MVLARRFFSGSAATFLVSASMAAHLGLLQRLRSAAETVRKSL